MMLDLHMKELRDECKVDGLLLKVLNGVINYM
jgi:hypothetical protein